VARFAAQHLRHCKNRTRKLTMWHPMFQYGAVPNLWMIWLKFSGHIRSGKSSRWKICLCGLHHQFVRSGSPSTHLCHLLRLLERGPPLDYQRVVLLMLKSLLQQTHVDPSQIPQVYNVVSQLVGSALCTEALNVLEALLRSCSGDEVGSGENGHGMGEEVLQSMLLPQSSFKARSGPLQYGAGSLMAQGGGGSAADSGLVALQNTRLLLGRVLDTCALGRKRDHKRLVPFVANIG
jgi:hypothetical protein